ncbi:MAG: hypothetical protein IT362_00485 [Deltaproteobacteria bacterium]|nr:hypothetical protein [Deltaproteobacteria bacterium]
MKNKLRFLTLLAMALPVVTAGASQAAQLGGVISFEDYYSGDTASGSRHAMTGRLKLDITKIGPSQKIGFHFDARQRFDLSGEISTSSKEGRIDQAQLEYAGTSLYLSIGRLWPKDMPIEVVDGVNAVYQGQGSKTGFGVYAGLRPNPYSQSTTADFTSAGLYLSHAGEKLSAGAAFVHNGYKGDTDRQYFYGYGTWMPRPSLFALGNITADLSPSGEVDLTNLIAELTWRPDEVKSFTLGYNQFRAFKYYASTLFADIDDSRQDGFYLGATYRLNPQYMVYGRVETQKRFFPATETGQNNMLSYRAGVSGDNVLNTGVFMNLSASVTDSYGSEYTAYSFDMSRMLGESVQLMFNGAYTQNVYGASSSGGIVSFGGSAFYMARRWNLSLSVDTERGTDYTTNRILTRVSFNL